MDFCVLSSKSQVSIQKHVGTFLQGGRKKLRKNHMMPCFQGEPQDILCVELRIFREGGIHSSWDSNYCMDPK